MTEGRAKPPRPVRREKRGTETRYRPFDDDMLNPRLRATYRAHQTWAVGSQMIERTEESDWQMGFPRRGALPL